MMNLKSTPIVLFCLLAVGFLAYANPESQIQINSAENSLNAPAGSDYRWFKDGKLIFGQISEELRIQESGTYTVHFVNESGKTDSRSVAVEKTGAGIRRIFLIGDSTVQNYNSTAYPMMGWGQVLSQFFDDALVSVHNRAIGGRSSRSFYEEGRWDNVKAELQSGDFVFIQFGHNDRDFSNSTRYTDTADYKDYLRIYVDGCREKDAIPVLVSPMLLNSWNGDAPRNVFTEGTNDYRGAMEEVANLLGVHFIDLNKRCEAYFTEIGEAKTSNFLFMILQKGEYSNYQNGSNDFTHFQEMGAYAMAKLVVDGLQELSEDANTLALTSAVEPLYELSVSTNTPSLKKISPGGWYPEGANITIKSIIGVGSTFKQWSDSLDQVFALDNFTKFTMTADNYKLEAIIEDCAGASGGDAFVDDCLTCITDVETTPACVESVESEDACEFNGDIDTEDQYGQSTEYVTFHPDSAGLIHFALLSPSAGEKLIGLKYRSGNGPQMMDVYVNSELVIDDAELPETDTELWGTTSFNAALGQGENYITLVFKKLTTTLELDMMMTYESYLSKWRICTDTEFLKLNNKLIDQLRFYPNPFTTSATLSTSGSFEYRILSLSGATLEQGTCAKECQIGSQLAAGMYVLNFTTKNESHSFLISKD